MKLNVWRIVEGTEVAPAEEDVGAYRKFIERRDRALANIVLGVDAKLLYLLGDPQDPVQVWKLLSNQFQKKTWSNKLALKRKLYGLKLKDQESVQEHLKSMVEIFDELAVIGDAVEEEDKVVHILTSLPESYGMLVTALEASVEVPKLELVTEKILNEERKLKEKCSSSGGLSNPVENALFTNSRNKTCFYCGEVGHIKRFCDELRKKNEEQQKERQKEPAVANFSYHSTYKDKVDFDSDTECIALISEAKQIKKKWIVDSAATHHMSNDENEIQDLRRLRYPQNVKVGNGEYVQANYVGTVMLLVKAGSKTRKIKLLDVLFAPSLKYNLFSVSKATEKENKVEFIKSGCRIVNRLSRELIVSASKEGNLYYLDCLDRDQNQRQKMRITPRKEMEIALLSVKENNFKEEMMRRLSSIEKDSMDMEIRLNKFEEGNSLSYSFKEDVCQNQTACENGDLMKFLENNRGDKFCCESEFEDSSDEGSDMENNLEENQSVLSKEEENELELHFEEVPEESILDSVHESYIEYAQGEDENIEIQKRSRILEDLGIDEDEQHSVSEPAVTPPELLNDDVSVSVKDHASSSQMKSKFHVLKRQFSRIFRGRARSTKRK